MNNGTLVRRGDKWYIDWTDATGKRHRKTTGTDDRVGENFHPLFHSLPITSSATTGTSSPPGA